MTTAKIFENGRSQAVRLPKEYRFEDDEVMINKIGDVVVLFPKAEKWSCFAAALDLFTVDFMDEGRGLLIEQSREQL